MGNDGGSIPTRRELVKEGAKDVSTTKVKEIQAERQEHYWTTCALSHQPLAEPVVSDGLGTLYNKDAVLSHLLEQSQKAASSTPTTSEDAFAQIARKDAFKDRLRSLRDVVEVIFEPLSSTGRNGNGTAGGRWICPITNKVLGPGTKAVYLVPCGHAFAESVTETLSDEKKCLQCDRSYETANVIAILPTSQEVKDRLTERLRDLDWIGLSHSLKKAPKDSHNGAGGKKKRKKAGPAEPEAAVDTASRELLTENAGTIRNKGTAALTEKVMKEQEERNKRRKMAGSDNANVQSLFSKGDGMDAKQVDFMTRGFSIQTPSPATAAAKR